MCWLLLLVLVLVLLPGDMHVLWVGESGGVGRDGGREGRRGC